MRKIIRIILLICLLPARGFSQNVGLPLHSPNKYQTGGPCWAVAVKDSVAYIGNGELLQVLDVSDPYHPQVICERNTGGDEIFEILLSENFLYIGVNGWLIIYDISKPEDPLEQARLEILIPGSDTNESLREMLIHDHYLFVANNYLYVIDIENPAIPQLISLDNNIPGLGPPSLANYEHYLYYGDATPNGSCDIIWDISEHSNPTKLQTDKNLGYLIFDMVVMDNYLFVADVGNLGIGYLADPLGPEFEGVISYPNLIRGICVAESLVYINFALNTNKLSIVNMSEPTQPNEVGNLYMAYSTESFIHCGLYLSYPYLYAACYNGLWIVDVLDANNPKEVCFFTTLQTSIEIDRPGKSSNLLKSFQLHPNRPNPFNVSTCINYDLFDPGLVTLEIFNILGEKIVTLVNEFQKIGRYEVYFNATDLPSMIYLCRLKFKEQIKIQRMILAK